jgi:SAM-dependent methyltransferase
MPGYESYAAFYDATQGDRAAHADYVRSLLEKHHPKAKTLLELACGTGSVLAHLRDRYDVTGVDLSEQMLERAAEKLPGARLIHADMTTVDLGETFDAVLCLYDSINHLLRFQQWEQVFDCARVHLADRGVFVFDINTERQLAAFADAPPVVERFDEGNVFLIDVQRRADDVFVWRLEVFERIRGAEYRLHIEEIAETSFPVERIRRSLDQRYSRVAIYDARRTRPTTRSERLHFVCRR